MWKSLIFGNVLVHLMEGASEVDEAYIEVVGFGESVVVMTQKEVLYFMESYIA